MNRHPQSIFGELAALGLVFLTISLFVISLPAIFLSTIKLKQDQNTTHQQYLETSVS